MSLYAQKRELPVEDNIVEMAGCEVVRRDFLAMEAIKKVSGDVVRRSLMRHDSDKLAEAIINLLNN